MLLFKKQFSSFIAFLVISPLSMTAYSQDNSADSILRQANLPKLVDTNQAVNLSAQPKDPEGSGTNINSFDDFVAIGVTQQPTVHTNFTNFNKQQDILKKVTQEKPWVGVANYLQKDIPNVSLQDGYIAARGCIKNNNLPIHSDDVGHVTIYKTINTGQFVYDYAFKVPGKTSCQEVLYMPATQRCEIGMQVACHIAISTMSTQNASM